MKKDLSKSERAKKITLKIVFGTLSVLAWILIWKIASVIIDTRIILPSPESTLLAFLKLSVTFDFWLIVLYSLGRILLGFLLGVIFGIALALMYRFLPFTRSFLSIGMNVTKSTPVAVLVLVLWFIVGPKRMPAAIALMMVAPIIWQNAVNGFDAIDKRLDEVCTAYSFTGGKKFKYLVFPTIYRHVFPALISSSGLAWKAGVAAEIIAATPKAIGMQISLANSDSQTAEAFAWAISIIILSISIEKIMQFFLKKGEKAWQ